MKFTNANFGAKIIETITSGLYDGNLNCLREYIQNSIDARAKNIKIHFENGRKNLVIEDDGIGMNRKELEECLSVGISRKTSEEVGWRGLGIWSGVPACERIVIITKKKNNKKYRIEIDNEILRAEIETNKPATEVLSNATGEIEEIEMGKDESMDDQFTIIRLESILPTQYAIFREEDVRRYLQRVIPAPFDEEKFPIAKKINKELEKQGIKLPKTNIVFEGKPIYRPPYDANIFFDEPIFKEFKIRNEIIAFGWFLTTNQNAKLKEPNNGIYFKKKGFTIGDKNLVINLYDGTYNEWQYGEIHIISDKLKENAPRNNFEFNNEIVEPFLKLVGEFIKDLQQMNRYQSDKVVRKYVARMKSFVKNGDYKSALNEYKKIKKKISRSHRFPKDNVFRVMKRIIDNESQRNIKEAEELKKEINKMRPEILKQKEILYQIVDGLPPPLKKHLSKVKKHALLEPEINVMEEIVKLLKRKTGLETNDLRTLSQEAYGWREVKGEKGLLTLTSGQDNKRDRRFGVMIYTMYDLFVNPFKHEKGTQKFEWFEKCTEEEKYQIITGMYGALGMIYKLIERSKSRRDLS